MGKGTKAEDGDFVLRAIAGDNDVALVLEKITSEQKGNVIIPKGVTKMCIRDRKHYLICLSWLRRLGLRLSIVLV